VYYVVRRNPLAQAICNVRHIMVGFFVAAVAAFELSEFWPRTLLEYAEHGISTPLSSSELR
jgi:hypothetical protein